MDVKALAQHYNQIPMKAQTAKAREDLTARNQAIIDNFPLDIELTADYFPVEDNDNADG